MEWILVVFDLDLIWDVQVLMLMYCGFLGIEGLNVMLNVMFNLGDFGGRF